MNSTDSFTTESLTSIDDGNGSLVDDWETYKSYTRFYYITDEVFLYANPILIIIGNIYQLKSHDELIKIRISNEILTLFRLFSLLRYSNTRLVDGDFLKKTYASVSSFSFYGHAIFDEHINSCRSRDDAMVES